VRGLWDEAHRQTSAPAGALISSFDDQRVIEVLGVHGAFSPDDLAGMALPVLPAYVRRGFDASLDEVVEAAAHGSSAIALLIGGSSTGKTRAYWEAVRSLPEGWRLWPATAEPR
jgi:hypothetical protein